MVIPIPKEDAILLAGALAKRALWRYLLRGTAAIHRADGMTISPLWLAEKAAPPQGEVLQGAFNGPMAYILERMRGFALMSDEDHFTMKSPFITG